MGHTGGAHGPAGASVNEVFPVAHGRTSSGIHDTFSIICIS